MEIRVYDSNLMFMGLVENYTSFQWHRRYTSVGDFELHTPNTPQLSALLGTRGRIVTYRSAGEAAIIESIQIDESTDDSEIVVQGRFLPCYMSRRIIKGTVNFSGTVEAGMRKLLSEITPAIPNVGLGELHGFTDRTEFQVTYKDLLEYETDLAQSFGYGFKFVPDFENKEILFEVYQGLNKTRTNGVRAFVEFSDDFNNLESASYFENDQLYKNVAYVGGQGEGADRVVVEIGDTESTGLERREIFIDARDLEKTDEMTDTEYRALLRQRGLEKMQECMLAETFECETLAGINFVYRQDYDLGDIVTVRKRAWGKSKDLRITEIVEVYEHERAVITPVFGDDFYISSSPSSVGGGGSISGGGSVTAEDVGTGQYEEPLIQVENGGTGVRTIPDFLDAISTEYTDTGTVTGETRRTKTWTVSGSGILFVFGMTACDTTNSYGSTIIQIKQGSTVVACEHARTDTRSGAAVTVSAATMLKVTNGETITVEGYSTKGGTKTITARAMAFGCTLS